MNSPKIGDEATGSYRIGNDSQYLAADDFPADGKSVSLVITKGTWEEVIAPNNRKKQMWCLHFKGTEKKLALNNTNAKTLTSMFDSNEITSWYGKKIDLFRAIINAFGNPKTPAIRIKT